MSRYESGFTPVSEQYKQMFIDPDTKTFRERKQYIDGVLKPDLDKKNKAESDSYGLFYKAKSFLRNVKAENISFQDKINELKAEKKRAEDRARDEALKNGATPDEANRAALKAGESFDAQIKGLNFWQAPQMKKSLSDALSNFSATSDAYKDSHSAYLSADITLFGNLTSQSSTASDISRNTQHYNFLRECESRMNKG